MIWDFFDRIVYINLDRRKDRREECEQEFARMGIPAERFPAVEHADGHIGIIKSTLAILQQAKKDKLSNVLIFEDDVKFTRSKSDTEFILANAILALPTAWDMFYLGGAMSAPCRQITMNLAEFQGVCAHSVAISSQVFQRIIYRFEYTNQIFKKSDINDVYYVEQIHIRRKSFLAIPMLCTQRAGYSDLEQKHLDYSKLISESFSRFAC